MKRMVMLIAVSCGGSIGWYCGSGWGIMSAYFASVLGSAIGLYLGRKLQRNLGWD